MFTTLSTSFSLPDEIVDVHLSGRKKGKGKKESGQRASLDGDDAIELACAVKQWQNNVRTAPKNISHAAITILREYHYYFPPFPIFFLLFSRGKTYKEKHNTDTPNLSSIESSSSMKRGQV